MLPANTYVIRPATDDDQPALEALAELDSQGPLDGPALVGEIDGHPAAAISLQERRVMADQFLFTVQLRQVLRMRAAALHARGADAFASRPRAGGDRDGPRRPGQRVLRGDRRCSPQTQTHLAVPTALSRSGAITLCRGRIRRGLRLLYSLSEPRKLPATGLVAGQAADAIGLGPAGRERSQRGLS